jgi:hypothetical protein
VVAIAGLITPGTHNGVASAGIANPPAVATNANGVPIAPKVPYDCRPADTPQLSALVGHQHASGFEEQAIAVLSPSTCAELERQLTIAGSAAKIAPTLGDAYRLGYRAVGYYSPGLGMHMEIPGGIRKTFDPAQPAYLLYGGNQKSAPIVGYAFSVDDPNGIPAMFAGGHDVPHNHGYCTNASGVADLSVGQGNCTKANATDANDWLVHTWAVPGKPSAWGVFSDANPALTPHGYDAKHLMSAHTLDCYYETRAYQTPYKGCSLTPA